MDSGLNTTLLKEGDDVSSHLLYGLPKKVPKRLPNGPAKASGAPSPKKYAGGSPKKGTSKDDISRPIKRSALESLAQFDFLTPFARKVEAHLNDLPPSQRYVAYKAVEDVLKCYRKTSEKPVLKLDLKKHKVSV